MNKPHPHPHPHPHRLAVLLCILALGAWAGPALGSGTYTARPPQPRHGKKSIDNAKYSLGQRVFDGKVQLSAQAAAATQTDRLKALQARLPASVAAKKNLPGLAGQLSAEQLDALEYFVAQRYVK